MKKLTILTAAALLVVAAGVGYAAIPSSSGTISACKDNKGVLRAIDAEAGQACPQNQQLLTWNQQGPAGAQGPAGPQGPTGPSDAFFAHRDGTAFELVDGVYSAVETLNLPAGAYVVIGHATAYADDNGQDAVDCAIPYVDFSQVELAAERPAGELVFAGAIRLQQPGSVSLLCRDRPGDGAIVSYVKLEAIKVATLTNAS